MTHTQNIHRRPDGSIDFDHYDRIARGLRAHDQRAAMTRLAAPMIRLLRTLASRPSSQLRALFRT